MRAWANVLVVAVACGDSAGAFGVEAAELDAGTAQGRADASGAMADDAGVVATVDAAVDASVPSRGYADAAVDAGQPPLLERKCTADNGADVCGTAESIACVLGQCVTTCDRPKYCSTRGGNHCPSPPDYETDLSSQTRCNVAGGKCMPYGFRIYCFLTP